MDGDVKMFTIQYPQPNPLSPFPRAVLETSKVMFLNKKVAVAFTKELKRPVLKKQFRVIGDWTSEGLK